MGRKVLPEPWEYEEFQECKACQKILPLAKFHKAKSPHRTHRVVCKDCASEQGARLVALKVSFIKEYKTNNPCVDCGKYYHYYAMDFDHVRGKKFAQISDMWGCSIEKIKEEITKCDLVCATCHRLRTWKRKEFIPEGSIRRGTDD